MNAEKQYIELKEQVTELQQQLSEAHEIIDAIRKGEVDAFIVKNGEDKHQIYTLKSADIAYRLFIEKMSEGAVTFNEEGIVIYSNSSFAKLFNIPLKNVIGNSFINLIPITDREVVNDLIKKAWREEESKTEIIVNNNKIGVPVLLSMNKLEIDGGIALSVIATDLSLQKETQQQKITMEKMDEFISIASHELKTPVTSIKGYVQLLKHNFQKQGHETASGLLSRVEGQVNKLAALVTDLLDVKKIETGQLQYNEEPFEINELINEIVQDAEMNLKLHTITRDFCSPQLIVNGDRNKIGQVISNFLDNAVKYSPHNGTIQLKTSVEADKICIAVKDEGIGIPLEKQSKLFERFYRVRREKENTYSGLGLGLYISAEIIKRHNGIIGVESKGGKSSTFYFKLPVSN